MKKWIALVVALAVGIGTGLSAGEALAAPVANPNWDVKYEQIGQSAKIKVTIPGAASLKQKADKVKLSAKLIYKGKATRTVTMTKSLSTLAADDSFTLTVKDWGSWKVKLKFYKGKKQVKVKNLASVKVRADEYVIAPLSGTLPGTILTTSLWGPKSLRGKDNQIPVIVQLARAHQWNWSKLPDGVRPNAFLTKKQYTGRHNLNYTSSAQISAMKAYVKSLYSTDNTSKFHFYVNDATAHLVMLFVYANQIPETNYDITFLSDGTHSYSMFANAYGGADPQAVQDKYLKDWKAGRDYAVKHGKIKPKTNGAYWRARLWAAVKSDPNARWMIGSKEPLNPAREPSGFRAEVEKDPQVTTASIGANLKEIQNLGPTVEKELKNLYKFNDSYFAGSAKKGQKVMVLLGTRLANEAPLSFDAYANFVKKFYGKSYDYYYKGHPATPTDQNPAKAKQLKSLGLTDVQSSVPAELIAFFNPKVYWAGYGSTTFRSLGKDVKEGLFNSNIVDGGEKEYVDMKWFMNATANLPAAIKTLATNEKADFGIQFRDTAKYDVALWNSSKQTISYFKLLVDGTYQKVK